MDIIILLLAVVWDLALGEPPKVFHPTVWFGKIAEIFDNLYQRRTPLMDFLAGVVSMLSVCVFAFFLAQFPTFIAKYSTLLTLLVSVYLLKSSFAIKSLAIHVRDTIKEDIEEQRVYVRLIVSRDVKSLNRPHLVSASIESLAENIVDSVVAPMFYFLLFGLEGALVYRAINTLDAMIGYRNEQYEFFGKFTARMDDIANFLPARLVILLFLPFAPRRVLSYYKMAKFKINGDKPIAAMSAVLGVWLEKKGVYRFEGKEPTLEDIRRALTLYWLVVGEWIAFVCVFEIIKLFFM
ncbi:cobalamin biosynthesis protein CobD [Thermococcus sp. MV5]|uniref:adenosylcobinamide-phosphate synthase CbiB n=1 Tax=Thermococcus sp. MV5 TaxID=1638272 RepID=UPI0014393D81|nr:adenosylcobinamide-phosphate synthase CbiB [Thermococcus sp. MV5]NJE26727.1 cobalamin biosynthesis protein CobD [Thermococcus sp. MV5]